MRKLFFSLIFIAFVVGCANMDSKYIDGGWYDEDPPKVLACFPTDKATNVNTKKISIVFDEYIKIENATENVIISPPQIEPAEIVAAGKKILVQLKDSLKSDITYTVDFSDAISDNNEGNPLGNYTYSFSTGNSIDTLQVGGYVLNSETLEPVQGILVGLYEAEKNDSVSTHKSLNDASDEELAMIDSIDVVPFDSTFLKKPFLRVARTDSRGHFVVKGVKAGHYKVYALKDQDNNFMLTPNSGEQMAFLESIVSPYVFDDTRQDTIMLDSLRIKSIDRVPYKHFMPDDLILMAFTEPQTDRAYLKYDRQEANRFTLFFSYGDSLLPEVKGLNFDSDNAFLVLPSEKKDTITYWLRDTALVNNDSLEIELNYRMTDTLGLLKMQTDTILLLPKVPYAKRQKEKQKEYEVWEKQQQKNKKKGQPYDSIKAPDPLKINVNAPSQLDPDRNVSFEFPTPLACIDSSKIHLYIERDSNWYNAEWQLREKKNTKTNTLELLAEWEPEFGYSLEVDSAAFTDIYGAVSNKIKNGLKIRSLNDYGTFEVTLVNMVGKNVIVQLLENGEKLVKEVYTNTGKAKFFYLAEKKYYMKLIEDNNNNKVWDTGKFNDNLQPENVYYYPKEINIRAKWNITETWDPTIKPRNEQKPSELRKSKSSTKKKQQTDRNLKRAQSLGIELPDYLKKKNYN